MTIRHFPVDDVCANESSKGYLLLSHSGFCENLRGTDGQILVKIESDGKGAIPLLSCSPLARFGSVMRRTAIFLCFYKNDCYKKHNING